MRIDRLSGRDKLRVNDLREWWVRREVYLLDCKKVLRWIGAVHQGVDAGNFEVPISV